MSCADAVGLAAYSDLVTPAVTYTPGITQHAAHIAKMCHGLNYILNSHLHIIPVCKPVCSEDMHHIRHV